MAPPRIEIVFEDPQKLTEVIQFLEQKEGIKTNLKEDPFSQHREWRKKKMMEDNAYREKINQQSREYSQRRYETDETYRNKISEANKRQYLKRKSKTKELTPDHQSIMQYVSQ